MGSLLVAVDVMVNRTTWLARGVYAIAAVFVGALFVAAAYFADAAGSWGREDRLVYGFMLTYGLAVAGGFLVQAVFALLLRWLTCRIGLHRHSDWVGLGAVLGVAVPWSAARIGYWLDGVYFPTELQRVKAVFMFALQGSMMYVVQPVWVLLAVGAATGFVLRPIAWKLLPPPGLTRGGP
jgi:hypothetical protein